MMSYVIFAMMALSILCGALAGRMELVSNAILSGCGEGVSLALSLAGTLCLWSGIMKIAEQSGLTEKISLAFRPLTRRLFPSIPPDSRAMGAITMNLSANLLGLGNAATPLGITAMTELERQAGFPQEATLDMVTFVVLNTASLQLLPTTNAYLRLAAGSANPMEILPAVWISSTVSISIGVLFTRLLNRRQRRGVCRVRS